MNAGETAGKPRKPDFREGSHERHGVLSGRLSTGSLPLRECSDSNSCINSGNLAIMRATTPAASQQPFLQRAMMAAWRRSRRPGGKSYISCDRYISMVLRVVLRITSQCPQRPKWPCSSARISGVTESSIRSSRRARNSLHFTSHPLFSCGSNGSGARAAAAGRAKGATSRPECSGRASPPSPR